MNAVTLKPTTSTEIIPNDLLQSWNAIFLERSGSRDPIPVCIKKWPDNFTQFMVELDSQEIGFLQINRSDEDQQAEIVKFYLEPEHQQSEIVVEVLKVLENSLTQLSIYHVLVNVLNCYADIDPIFSRMAYQLIPCNKEKSDQDNGLCMEKHIDV